jgi:hypothetical protein
MIKSGGRVCEKPEGFEAAEVLKIKQFLIGPALMQ